MARCRPWALRAARQQLPRLRLCLVLGEHPRRCRAPAGGVREARPMIAAGIADFRAALPEGGRLLGLDVGTKTIGTALCDAGWTIASAATLIRRTRFARDLDALKALIDAQDV